MSANGFATWLPDVLRGAGLDVVTYGGWETRGHSLKRNGVTLSESGFTDLTHVTWHHDASRPGPSPGVPKYMLGNWDKSAAQLWVSEAGVWHVLAAGAAFHAGKVRPGKPGNRQSLGVETDHTTGEDWPPALLRSLRVGTAAILDHLETTAAAGLEFHKTICEPPGRKTDPDGLDLLTERVMVARLMAPPSLLRTTPPASPEDPVTDEQLARVLLPLLERQTIQITGGRRVRTPEGQVEDPDPTAVSNADVLTGLERLGDRLVAEIRSGKAQP